MTHADYDFLDLIDVPEDYLPRSKFAFNSKSRTAISAQSICRWDKTRLHSDLYRLAVRKRINLTSERSLIAAVLPKKLQHIDSVRTIAFSDLSALVNAVFIVVNSIRRAVQDVGTI